MEHNKVRVSIDAAAVNRFLSGPNPSPTYGVSGGGAQTPYEQIIETFKKLDQDEIPFQLEKWTTTEGSKVYLVYNTMDHQVFITGLDPTSAPQRE